MYNKGVVDNAQSGNPPLLLYPQNKVALSIAAEPKASGTRARTVVITRGSKSTLVAQVSPSFLVVAHCPLYMRSCPIV